jgi:hypothetical protein
MYMLTNIVGLNEGVPVGSLVGFKEEGEKDGDCDGPGVFNGLDGCDVVGC